MGTCRLQVSDEVLQIPSRHMIPNVGHSCSSKVQRNLEHASAMFKERQIKSHQVVILDRIGVEAASERAEVSDEGCLLPGSRCLRIAFKAPIVAHGYQEDAAACRILTLDAAKWRGHLNDLDAPLVIVEIADPDEGPPAP